MEASAPMPTLETERLTLRPFTLEDASEVQRQAGNAKIAATTGSIPHPYPDGFAEQWITGQKEKFLNGTEVNWAIEVKASRKLVGCMILMVKPAHRNTEIGYWIGEPSWGKGYGTEAAAVAIQYAFEVLKVNKVTARYVQGNEGSGVILRKNGLVQEGYLREEGIKNGKFFDLILCGLLERDWRQLKAKA